MIIPLEEEFNISKVASISGLTTFAFGTAVGPILASPISELFGRAAIQRTALPITTAFLIGTGAAKNFQTIAIMRFLSGVASAPCTAVGGGVLADVWDMQVEPLGGLFVLLYLIFTLSGGGVGIVAGFFLIAHHSWRWIFWVSAMLTGIVSLLALALPETYRSLIKQKKRGTRDTADHIFKRAITILHITTSRATAMPFTDIIQFLVSLYAAFTFGLWYVYYIAYPYVLSTVYAFNTEDLGRAYSSTVIGATLAIPVAGIVDKIFYQKARARAVDGRAAPEARLYGAMLASILLPVSLFWQVLSSLNQAGYF